jgi:hypothetical protein
MTEKIFTLTHASTHTATRWDDRHTYAFDALVQRFTAPTVGPKEGPCYTPAVFRGTERKMDHAEEIDVAVLDSDCGHTLEEIRTAIGGKGWTAIIHSTASHLKTTTEIAAPPYEKWAESNPGHSVEKYLLEKKSCLPRVLSGAQIVGDSGTGSKRKLTVELQPCPKFRILLPLAKPWRATDFPNQGTANSCWRERVNALAHALELHHDQSCAGTQCLFFLPRIVAMNSPFECAVLR